MINPDCELADEHDGEGAALQTGRIVPVYRTTEGISQRQFRTVVHAVLETFLEGLHDPLPAHLITAHRLLGLRESLANVHFPAGECALDDLNRGVSAPHQRLAFDELFFMQLGVAALRRGAAQKRGISFSPRGILLAGLREALPFTLTSAQEKALGEILADMGAPVPMNRLLQGDVGCGKTVVALMAMLTAVECGYQAALMAPTELLAEQHHHTIAGLVASLSVKTALITGSCIRRGSLSSAAGDAGIVVGTHALIQDRLSFPRLGLVVIDEQHRFGVLQRALLRTKGTDPDTLVMTATPIPRTLALTLYGDLDYSVIDELPPRRSPVKTLLIDAKEKEPVYRCIREETAKGRQVYVVYPVIEESEQTDLRAAVTGSERLQAMFPDLTVGLLHGRMKPGDREEVIARFRAAAIDILVSTTVIEVGVDVPAATLMVIVHAERFGLAQLHQLRGRVGRGADQSYCVLLSYNASGDARKRLDAMVRTTDGFRIAEEDLSIRGPGEFFGTRQSGLPDLRAANLIRDAGLLEKARSAAFALIEADPLLQGYPLLRGAAEEFWGDTVRLFHTG
jgi:ATP-dependent DNA helicase RecG